jgi:hypothetical protein
MIDGHTAVSPAAILAGPMIPPYDVLFCELDIEPVRDAHENEEADH